MFTIEQIKAEHAKVKTGAEYPIYIQAIIKLGVTGYENYVNDGNTTYFGKDGFKIGTGPKYTALKIADESDKAQFQKDLKAHQKGKTDFSYFCQDCAKSGIEKWVVDLTKMTCIYYDKAENEMLVEAIPVP